MWGFTPEESELYLDYCRREVLFREGVLYFLGDRSFVDGKKRALTPQDKFCEACKAKYKGAIDCSICDRKIQVLEDG